MRRNAREMAALSSDQFLFGRCSDQRIQSPQVVLRDAGKSCSYRADVTKPFQVAPKVVCIDE